MDYVTWYVCPFHKDVFAMNNILPVSKQEIETAACQAVAIIKANIPKYTSRFQDSNSIGNFYPAVENTEWTTGFCTGEYWLAYELSKDSAFKDSALLQVDSFLDRITRRIDINHHDMGFLYTPSCVAAYRLTGSENGRTAALMAADNLLSRFMEKGQFIQAWGELGAPDNYRLIIDCLLNLPLLYWATDITGNEKYRAAAISHTKTSLNHLIREDNSTYHTFFFDNETGQPLRGVTHQGYRDGSAWARGQAWGIYGLALSYCHTKNEDCIPLFKKVTDFFVQKLPMDMVPYWDLEFTDGDGEPKDSSSAAIAVCGMLEMCKYLSAKDAAYYHETALKILKSLIDSYAVKNKGQSNGLLLHGTYAKASSFNTVRDRGVDECNTWGDYFYLEALARLSMDWKIYW